VVADPGWPRFGIGEANPDPMQADGFEAVGVGLPATAVPYRSVRHAMWERE
jgi:hypothetical protein